MGDALTTLIWMLVALVGVGILAAVSFLFLALFVALFDNRNVQYKRSKKATNRPKS